MPPLPKVEATSISVIEVRNWCAWPDASVTVKPVIDLADHVRTDAYEIPDRIKERVALRDGVCVFPWCTRPARNLSLTGHDTDCDHIQPWGPSKESNSSGQTCTCNLAPLCRSHHRLKTHHGWSYQPLDTGTYLWQSPHGHAYLRDHTGTTAVGLDPSTSSGHRKLDHREERLDQRKRQ